MPKYDDTNTITIWGKGDNPKGPDLRVEVNDNGEVTRYALWKGEHPRGPKYRGTVEHGEGPKRAQKPAQAAPAPLDDDIDF